MLAYTYCTCSQCKARFKFEGASSGEMPCPKCGGQVRALPVAEPLAPEELEPRQSTRAAASPTAVLPEVAPPAGLDRRVIIAGWTIVAAAAIGAVVFMLQIAAQRDAPAVIKIDWPAEERARGSYEISGLRAAVPPKAALVFKVDPGPHRVVLRRPGFAPSITEFTLFGSEERVVKPTWQPEKEPAR